MTGVYNILTDRKDIIKPIGFHRESTALTDTDMKYLLLYLEETYGLSLWKPMGFMMSLRSVRMLYAIAPESSGSRWNTVRQFRML